jgi:long-chain fatty acid transport protein
MNTKLQIKVALFTAMAALSSQSVYATNGINLNGYGARSTAMGGVGIGMTVDAITATTINPAGTAFLDDRLDVGLLILNPQRRAACCNAPDGEVSDKGVFFIPNIGVSYKLDDTISFGVGMVGKGGGRTRYDKNFFSPGADPLGINLEVAEMTGTVSYKMNDSHAFGVGLVIVAQRFEAQGLNAFEQFSNDPVYVTDNQHDWSFGGGIRLGWQGKFMNDKLMLGAAYTSQRYTQKFDKYKGLFANGGEFDLPSDFGLGMSYKLYDDLTISFDWQKVFYTDSKSVSNSSLPISSAANDPRNLGALNGPGFGWMDQDIFKLGFQYSYSPEIDLMAGFNYGESPIPDTDGGGELEFNVLAPATTEKHLSVGGVYKLDNVSEITGTFWHAFKNTQTQFIPVGTGLPFENQTILIEMRQWGWEVGYAYKF